MILLSDDVYSIPLISVCVLKNSINRNSSLDFIHQEVQLVTKHFTLIYCTFQRLEQPECCPKDYFSVMLKCWQHDPNKRPKFAELINILPEVSCLHHLELQDELTHNFSSILVLCPQCLSIMSCEHVPGFTFLALIEKVQLHILQRTNSFGGRQV